MRARPASEYEALHDPARDYELPNSVGAVDWKESIATVLEIIDRLLEPHGLEIVVFDTRSDDYAFQIEPREPTAADNLTN